jgi:hypothetical protein
MINSRAILPCENALALSAALIAGVAAGKAVVRVGALNVKRLVTGSCLVPVLFCTLADLWVIFM